MFSSVLVSLFVRWQNYAETSQPIFTKFDRKVAHWPRKKPLDFYPRRRRSTAARILRSLCHDVCMWMWVCMLAR